MSYTSDCVDFILDALDEFGGSVVYACELGFKLTEDANINGSITFNTYQAREIVKSWDRSDRKSLENYLVNELGFDLESINHEDEPEKYHVLGIINGVDSLLSSCDYISDRWNDKIELTSDVIDIIKEQVENQAYIRF